MPRKIAVLDTSFVFASVKPIINELLAEFLPDAEVLHVVDSDVLATVVRESGVSPLSEQRMTHLAPAAEAAGAYTILSACSSLDPALDVAAGNVHIPVVKIDEAMVILAATDGARIGVLATVPTTLARTSDLIKSEAGQLGRSVSIDKRICFGAFGGLVSANRERHDGMVIEQAVDLANSVDTIVPSRPRRLACVLREKTGLPVLSSPRIGVEFLADCVAELTP